MDEPPIAEALLIEDGTVAAVGTRDEVLALAGDTTPVIDIGENVAYPGFIDAHAHWIGDREYYGLETPAEAMDAALTRGWTSITEQWVNPERLDELEALAADDALPLRVDAYLALNFDKEFLGDWYASREPGPVDDHLRVQGLKIHLDDGSGNIINWEPADLTATIARADEAGWQVSVHAMSSDGPGAAPRRLRGGARPHRAESAPPPGRARPPGDGRAAGPPGRHGHPDGDPPRRRRRLAARRRVLAEFDRDDPGEDSAGSTRWRDFVDAGLHVASATDAPWTFPDFKLTDDIGRPVDQIAAGMDGRVRSSPETPPWLLDQLLTADQGLRAVTVDAA